MPAPRLEVNYRKIEHNTKVLVQRLKNLGISVTGVTKAVLGDKRVANAMLNGGATALGDSRQANLTRLEQGECPLWLIRSPMMSQVTLTVESATVSCNTELDIINALSLAATKRGVNHGVIVMIELGDRREGVMPGQLKPFLEKLRQMPSITLEGIGVNLACASGVAPDAHNMKELSDIANSIETKLGLKLKTISGGNSANIDWAKHSDGSGRVNNLRLGESILLGCEALHRQPIDGLYTDAFTLVAEVIESKRKPERPRGTIGQTALPGNDLITVAPMDTTEFNGPMRNQSILAIGAQDIDSAALVAPAGITVLSTSSDHLVIDTGNQTLKIGAEVSFQLNYSALLRAMTSPFVAVAPVAQHQSLQTVTL